MDRLRDGYWIAGAHAVAIACGLLLGAGAAHAVTITNMTVVPRDATTAENFPAREQWEKADLVVCYCWPSRNGKWDYELVDAFQKRGGGLIFIHMALQHGSGQEASKRIGLAWGGGTKWGVLPTPVTVTDAGLKSPIFLGFPEEFDVADEFYWDLTGDPAGITTLMASPAGPAIANKSLKGPPKIEELDGKQWPVMWTKEVGKSRVFVTAAGHNYFTFNDPYFRIILLRAMAWTMNESFEPFKPLVTMHLER
jgi:type 1 glutamine amidotransferase